MFIVRGRIRDCNGIDAVDAECTSYESNGSSIAIIIARNEEVPWGQDHSRRRGFIITLRQSRTERRDSLMLAPRPSLTREPF